MLNCFQFCVNFAYNFNLRRYTKAAAAAAASAVAAVQAEVKAMAAAAPVEVGEVGEHVAGDAAETMMVFDGPRGVSTKRPATADPAAPPRAKQSRFDASDGFELARVMQNTESIETLPDVVPLPRRTFAAVGCCVGENDLLLDSRYASRAHAELGPEGEGHYVLNKVGRCRLDR